MIYDVLYFQVLVQPYLIMFLINPNRVPGTFPHHILLHPSLVLRLSPSHAHRGREITLTCVYDVYWHTRTHTCTLIHTCTLTHIRTHVCTCMHTCAHTHLMPYITSYDHPIYLSGWMARKSVRLYVDKKYRCHYLAMLGHDPPHNMSLTSVSGRRDIDEEMEEMEERGEGEGRGWREEEEEEGRRKKRWEGRKKWELWR